MTEIDKVSNIFLSIKKLTELNDPNKWSAEQCQFITSIIEGEYRGKRTWNNIKALARTPVLADINNIKAALEEEIRRTPYFSNFKYVRGLKRFLTDLIAMQKSYESLATISTKQTKRYANYVKRIDKFQDSLDKNHGTLMLPISQCLDVRLGNSSGECFGFIAEWAKRLLQNENPFGLRIDNPPPFKLAKPGRKFLDLNHLAVLTEDISTYQAIQRNLPSLMREFMNRSNNETNGVLLNEESILSFYKSVAAMAEELVTRADNQPQKIYNLNVMGYMGGHALGFCKREDGKYHFLDSNSGWVRFDNAEDFKRWLPSYFKLIGYDRFFGEYMINTYSLSSNGAVQRGTRESNEKKWSIGMWVAASVVGLLFSPLIVSVALWSLINTFIIRGFRYAYKAIKHSLNDRFTPVTTESSIQIKPVVNEQVQVTSKVIDALDLAPLAKNKRPEQGLSKSSSHSTINAMLLYTSKNIIKEPDLKELRERVSSNRSAVPLFKGKIATGLAETIANKPEPALRVQ